MASYFVVAATLDMAAHQGSALAVMSGAGTPLDLFFFLRAVLLLASAALFSLGRFTGVIARVWIAYSILHAFGTHAFWEGAGATVVLEHAGPFMADIAVAASLLLTSATARGAQYDGTPDVGNSAASSRVAAADELIVAADLWGCPTHLIRAIVRFSPAPCTRTAHPEAPRPIRFAA